MITVIERTSLPEWQQVLWAQTYDVYAPAGGNALDVFTKFYTTPGGKGGKSEVDDSELAGVMPSGSRRDLTDIHLPEQLNQLVTVNWHLQDVTVGSSTYGELWVVRGRPNTVASYADAPLGECLTRCEAQVKAPRGVPELRHWLT